MLPIILASSSPYRRQLLQKLQLSFHWQAPDIDEQAQTNESAKQLVARLAEQKAKALANKYPRHLIIGSDQVAVLNDKIITKPGDHRNAAKQLCASSGNQVNFYTGLCLYNSETQHIQTKVVPCHVGFKTLSADKIERYLEQEKPYDCAGSFKAEGLGISLFEYIRTDDPNSLIGLPLIELCNMLEQEGVTLP